MYEITFKYPYRGVKQINAIAIERDGSDIILHFTDDGSIYWRIRSGLIKEIKKSSI